MNKIESLYKEWQSLLPVKDEMQRRLNMMEKIMLSNFFTQPHLVG